MENINQTIDQAKSLGITLSNADIDSELCLAWADRVALAAKYFRQGDMIACQDMIDEANRYAI